MTQISIVFGNVRSSDVESYIRQRVYLLHYASASRVSGPRRLPSADTLNQYVEDICANIGRTSQLSFASPTDPLSLPSHMAKAIRSRYESMIEEIDRSFPLIDGEYVEEDLISYLENDWAEFPAEAMVVRRLTNLAEMYYVYPDVRANGKEGPLIEPAPVSGDGSTEASDNAGTLDFGAAAETLAEGLAGLAPPPLDVLGAALISLFWPSADDATAQWQQIYNELQQIVKNALAENNVQLASEKLQGFVAFLDNEYQALKSTQSVTKEQLLQALAPYDTAFFLDIVNIFMLTNSSDEGIAAASLANFMTGACLHLGLNQERALQDPSVPNPSSSAYAKTVSNLAATYAAYARKTAPYVKQLRLAQISSLQQHIDTICRGNWCNIYGYYWFTDSNNGYQSPSYSFNSGDESSSAEGDAQKALTAYYNSVSSQMDAMLQKSVYDVASNWDKLVSDPVHQPPS